MIRLSNEQYDGDVENYSSARTNNDGRYYRLTISRTFLSVENNSVPLS